MPGGHDPAPALCLALEFSPLGRRESFCVCVKLSRPSPVTVNMGTIQQGQMVLADSLSQLHTSDPAFIGAEVTPCIRSHGEHAGKPTGMHIKFANGMTFSIQWHDGAYSNVGRGYWEPEEGEQPDFETAAWYPEEYATRDEDGYRKTPWYDPRTDAPHRYGAEGGSCDQVQGYQTVAEVMETARKVANHRLPNAFTAFDAIARIGDAIERKLLPSDRR